MAMLAAFAVIIPASCRVTRQLKADATIRLQSVKENIAERPFPSVSVVVYDFSKVTSIGDYLDALCRQDWPSFSVVLVSDASAADARELQERYRSRFPRVHFTFIPPGSHNLSRRKLAFTIGIKAADSDFILTTVSNCTIPSPQWISLMMAPVMADPAKKICLGLSRPDFNTLRGVGKWYRQFDFTLRSMQWIAAAVAQRPVRGDGYNLLFSRSLFFSRNGYSSTAYLDPGDDDLFLTEIADNENTALQLNRDSVLVQQWEPDPVKALSDQKERYDFTSRFLPRRPFFSASAVSWTQWIVFLGCVGSILTSGTAAVIYIPLSAGLLFVWWGFQIYLYRKAAVATATVRLWWSIPVFTLWRPLGNLLFRMRHRSSRHRHFTWRPS